MTGREVVVVDPGPLTTVQDDGRPGWAHLGVPRAGVLDAPAAARANRLVGNDPAAAVLETTLGGVTLRLSAAMTVAVTGAPADVRVSGRAAAFGEPLSVGAGEVLRVGPARRGVRSYVALAGGVAVEPVLGSRSTDTLAFVGPGVLRAGDVVPVGPAPRGPAPVDVTVGPTVGGAATLRLLPGPRIDWFTSDALETLATSTYVVTEESNRVGLRLDGAPLTRRDGSELPSEGVVLGAVQVPPSGLPLVFLHDHPTTGGYPVAGVVPGEDLTACAQLRPGDEVRFRVSRPPDPPPALPPTPRGTPPARDDVAE
jgi:biotin-dependent carboxylase-like uncharacterized protein